MTGKQTSPERPTPKSPIFSCEVIQAACMALEALQGYSGGNSDAAVMAAIRIIANGLEAHERAIKGETT